MVLEMSVSFVHRMQLIAREDFIEKHFTSVAYTACATTPRLCTIWLTSVFEGKETSLIDTYSGCY
jgi:hypothetical protein